MIRCSIVPVEGLRIVWPLVEAMLKRATDDSYGRYDIDDLMYKVFTGEFVLWIVVKDEDKIIAAVTSTFNIYPQGKFLSGQFLGGEELPAWRDSFCEIFDRWGRDNGCKAVEFVGRAGWSKALAPQNYREIYRVYQKEL